MPNKKTQFTILTILGILVLFFVVLKTKSLYFSNNGSHQTVNLHAQNKINSEKLGLKTVTVPKLTVYGNVKIIKEKPPQQTEPESEEKNPDNNSQSLTSKYLNQVLSQQQIYFTRCYENHLRENTDNISSGNMLVEFMVLPHGEIRDVVIKESNFQNKTFENCIKTVFARTQLKKFNGDKFLILYPLEFE